MSVVPAFVFLAANAVAIKTLKAFKDGDWR